MESDWRGAAVVPTAAGAAERARLTYSGRNERLLAAQRGSVPMAFKLSHDKKDKQGRVKPGWASYKHARSITEAKDLGATDADLLYDLNNGILTVYDDTAEMGDRVISAGRDGADRGRRGGSGGGRGGMGSWHLGPQRRYLATECSLRANGGRVVRWSSDSAV